MRRYLKYLSYVIRHKYYVFIFSIELGIPLLGILHDWSKFTPAEFGPYARAFYNPDGSPRQKRDSTGYYKPSDTGMPEFELAWLHHVTHNKHHWQHWAIADTQAEGGAKLYDIPEKYCLEMVADWMGAGAAQGKPDTVGWYKANKDKLMLSPRTREFIEGTLVHLFWIERAMLYS